MPIFFASTNSDYPSRRSGLLLAVWILNRRRTSIAAISRVWLNCATIIFGLSLANLCQAAERPLIGLDGEWSFRLDPQNVGVSQRWFENEGPLSGTIKVPARGRRKATVNQPAYLDINMPVRPGTAEKSRFLPVGVASSSTCESVAPTASRGYSSMGSILGNTTVSMRRSVLM